MRYLLSPKKNPNAPGEVHLQPHLVAGAGDLMSEWAGYDLSPALNPTAATQLAEWLDEPRELSKGQVLVKVRHADDGPQQQLDSLEEPVVVRREAHMWHCSLSLHPDEPPLEDEQWGRIAESFVQRMGLQDRRWLAVRHGESPGGNDHIHVVVQLVDFDGRCPNLYRDFPRAQEACRQLEHDFGLRVVEGREKMRGQRANTPRQRQAAYKLHQKGLRGTPEARIAVLERAVRTAAAASHSEGDFVRRLRAGGYVLRPRFEAGSDEHITGFSIAEPPGKDHEVIPYAAGRLSKDLTLPRLRGTNGWRADDPDGIQEWQRAFRGEEPSGPPAQAADVTDRAFGDALDELRNLRGQAAAVDAGKDALRARVAGQAAALAYTCAKVMPDQAAVLQRLGRELSLSAQVRARNAKLDDRGPGVRSLALLLASVSRPSSQALYWLALADELYGLAAALRDAHKASGELQRAHQLQTTVESEMRPALELMRDHAADSDPAYRQQLEAQRRRDQAAYWAQARPLVKKHYELPPPGRQRGRGRGR